MTRWIALNKNLDEHLLKKLGGKAYGLWKLLNLNCAIPTTHVLSTDYFQQYLDNHVQLPSYQKLLKLSVGRDREGIVHCLKSLQQEIQELTIDLPTELEQIVEQHLALQKKWAVRSSISVEDGKKHSYAGIFASFLHIDSLEEVKTKIKLVFVESFSQRSIFYTLENGIPLKKLIPAILIQEQTPVDWAGVYFTCHPSPTGNYQQGLISFQQGYGDSLMSGEQSGHSLLVEEEKISMLPPELSALHPVIKELVKMGHQMQQHTGQALDLEWGIKDQQIIFFQMRPMPQIDYRQAKSPIRWTRLLTEERYPEAVSPLGWSILYSVFQVNLDTLKRRFGLQATSSQQVARVIQDYVYANDSFFKFPENIKTNYFHQLKYLPHLIAEFLLSLISVPLLLAGNWSGRHKISIRLFFLMRFFSGYIFRHAREIVASWDRELPTYIQDFDSAYQQKMDLKNKQNTYQYRDRLEKIAIKYMGPDLAIYIIKSACVWMVNTVSKTLFPKESSEYLLLEFSKSLEKNCTLEMNLELKEMFQNLRQDRHLVNLLQTNQLSSALVILHDHPLFRRFLDKNGHLTSNWDIRMPTWEENPIVLMPLIKAAVLGSDHDLESKINLRLKEHREFCDQLFSSLRVYPFATSFLKNLNHYLREFMRIDEEHHFYCSRVFKATRAFYSEIAQCFVDENRLSTIDQIYFLSEEEIKSTYLAQMEIPLEFLSAKRKKQFLQAHSQTPVSSYLGDYIEEMTNANRTIVQGEEEKVIYLGECGSPGIIKGRVKIIKSIDDAKKINPGDILVSQSPNPVFTPLYSLVGGIVTNTGSLLSHGIVSAREYQIPAVTCINGIDKILKDDQMITVNGYTGEVILEKEFGHASPQ